MSPPRKPRSKPSSGTTRPRAGERSAPKSVTKRKSGAVRAAARPATKTRAKAAQRPRPQPAVAAAAVPAALSATQRRYLRGLSHDLHPVIMLGNKGISDAVIKELGLALDHHELVKVKLSGGDRDERQRQIDALVEGTGAESVQQIGHTATLYRRNAQQPKLALPR